ncbi:hypothetical protein ScPMuIL_012175 [Solemya velum]
MCFSLLVRIDQNSYRLPFKILKLRYTEASAYRGGTPPIGCCISAGFTTICLYKIRYKMEQYGMEIWSGDTPEDLPKLELGSASDEVFASYTGPDNGLAFACDDSNGNEPPSLSDVEIAGVKKWNRRDQKSYGICISLYEQHPVSGKMSGDPVADAFAICTRKNSCVMLIADGVNWGEKSRLAARSALHGAMTHINKQLFIERKQPTNTQEALNILKESFEEAHETILRKDGGLTTLCSCLVCPLKNSEEFVVCCANVGDSYGFIFSHNHGIREVTIGSHDVSSVRDIRDAGGALGPVDGKNPELHNLTFSLTLCHAGDIVFLTTDGISDNFDPVVAKVAVPIDTSDTNSDTSPTSPVWEGCIKPPMDPQERHIYSLKEMERIVHEFELVTEEQCSSQEFCGALVQHVLSLTDAKRKILENPSLYVRRRMTSKEKQRRDLEIVEKMSKAPGKLDHASIVAYEVGVMRTDEDEMDNISLQESLNTLTNAVTSPCSPDSELAGAVSPNSKKSRPNRLFAKIRKFGSHTSPLSPGQSSTFGFFPISPKKSSKRSRTKSEREHSEADFLSASSPTMLQPDTDFPESRSPTSPTSPELPLPTQHPYRKNVGMV